MSKTNAKFISNIPVLALYIVQKFLDINNLKWKDVIIIFSRMVLKRSFWDTLRSGGGPPGFLEIDEHYMEYLDEQVKTGKADQEQIARYKNLSVIERHSYQLRPVTRGMLKEIVEDIESGRLGKKNKAGGGKIPPKKVKDRVEEGKTDGG